MSYNKSWETYSNNLNAFLDSHLSDALLLHRNGIDLFLRLFRNSPFEDVLNLEQHS